MEIRAQAGDVFVIPAGVSHKTFDTTPPASFQLLTPGDGHGVEADDARQALSNIELSGFTMIGAYPNGSAWDFASGGEHSNNYEEVWAVPKPDNDPMLGQDSKGLCGLWQ